MNIAESLLPFFLVIGLGALLVRVGFFTPELLSNLNKIAYWIGMPALLFAAVSTAEISGARPMKISAVLLGATTTSLIVGYILSYFLKLPKSSVGTFVQSGFRGNLAFLAFPLTIWIFSRPGAPADAAEMTPIVALAIAPVMIVYAIAAIIVLVAGHEDLAGKGVRMLMKQILINPHVLAIGLGLIVALSGIRLPDSITATLKMVGGLAVPGALLGIGGKLVKTRIGRNLGPAAVATLIKIAVTPLAAYFLIRFVAMPEIDQGVAIVLAAAPTAAVSFVMSTQLRGDPELASSSIVLSTLGSVISLGIAVSLIQ